MAEAVESHISGWFWNAATQTRLRPVAQPQFDFELPASEDQDWEFTATVSVQAKPELADWTTLEVGAIEPEVPEELVEREFEALQSTVAELVPVEGRPVRPGRHRRRRPRLDGGGETRRDYVIELGRAAVVEEVEQGVVGLDAGATKEIVFELADGSTQTVSVTVKEIKEKVLPPLDDELARSASEFETLAELRAEIESRLLGQIAEEIEAQFRADVVDALVVASKVDASGPLVEARDARAAARPRAAGRGARRPVRHVSRDDRPGAGGADRAASHERGDAVGRARARARGRGGQARTSSVSDEAIETLVREQADASATTSTRRSRRLRETGRFETLRDDLRLRNALDRVASEVKRIPARARRGARGDLDARQGKGGRPTRNSGPPAAKEPHEPRRT